jgi:hypothetical protein
MKISEQQTLPFGEIESTYSREGGHANQFQQLENEKGKMMFATSGQKTLEQFEKFNRASLWAKTFAALLIGKGEFYSTRCKLTWKLKATKCSRFYFQLQASTLRTDETGYGLLPTPLVMDTNEQTDLEKIDARRARLKERNNGKNGKTKTGNGFGMTLGELLQRGLLPTPNTGDYRSGMTNRTGGDHNQSLNDLMALTTGKTSQLNPLFVTEMMGFPVDWLTSPFQDGEEKA